MPSKNLQLPLVFCISLIMFSCVSTNMSKYYTAHSRILDSINQTYLAVYSHRAFSLLFTDKSFKHISIEINTDTIKYIYDFELKEKRLQDTLKKFNLPPGQLEALLGAMKSIKCLWICNLDYYEEGKKNALVYMSIRAKSFRFPLLDKSYYILTYYSQPQYYDKEGRLVDPRRRRHLRKINKEIFKRINDKICYTVSNFFR